jgi:hypothetical protein
VSPILAIVPGILTQFYHPGSKYQSFRNTTNLSGFGVDFSDWVRVDYQVKNTYARILINGQPAYEGQLENDPGNIVGFRYQFTGAGLVKDHAIQQLQMDEYTGDGTPGVTAGK